jgi:hypothetical protein
MYLDTMPIITFLYYLPNNTSPHFGKFVSNPDLPEYTGIDSVVRKELVRLLNIENKVYSVEPYQEDDVHVGILSYTQDNAWTTYREVSAFDAYIEIRENGKYRRWTKGERLYRRGR